jgi:hypothetical protein
MPTFYFLWKPLKSRPELRRELGEVAPKLANGRRGRTWNTGPRTWTKMPPGSDFFLVRTGREPRGVIGYGAVSKGRLWPGDH